MNQRILEIINILEERLSEQVFDFSQDVMDELLFEGYKEHEIEEALSWIITYQNEKDDMNLFEISGRDETINVTQKAYNYLNNLLKQNIISENTFDDILTYCLFVAEGDVDIQNLRAYMMSFVNNREKWGKEARDDYIAYSLKKDC